MEEENKNLEVETLVVPTPEKPKKGSNILVIIIAILVLFLGGGFTVWGIILAANVTKEEVPKEEEKKEEKKPDQSPAKKGIDEERLMYFVEAGINSRNVGESNDSLTKGYIKPLTKYDEIKITLARTIEVDKVYEKIDSFPDEYPLEFDYAEGVDHYKMKVDDFKNTYKKLFNKNFEYDFSDLKHRLVGSQTCPYVLATDEKNGLIYLFSLKDQCIKIKQLANAKTLYKNISVDEDNDYYYVRQYIGFHYSGSEYDNEAFYDGKGNTIEVDKFEGNEEKFSKITWKFTKEYDFVSTTIE